MYVVILKTRLSATSFEGERETKAIFFVTEGGTFLEDDCKEGSHFFDKKGSVGVTCKKREKYRHLLLLYSYIYQ